MLVSSLLTRLDQNYCFSDVTFAAILHIGGVAFGHPSCRSKRTPKECLAKCVLYASLLCYMYFPLLQNRHKMTCILVVFVISFTLKF